MKDFKLSRRRMLWVGLGGLAGLGTLLKTGTANHLYYRRSRYNPLRSFQVQSSRPLREQAATKGLLYGAATDYHLLKFDPAFAARFAQECSILVPENNFKWRHIHPQPDRFDFTATDWLVTFTQTHRQSLRGHTLVWHSALPTWFTQIVNKRNAERFLVDHITTVAGRYAGRIHSWDVVNEAIHLAHGHPQGLRNTPWFQLLGPDYIDLAFRAAAAADPNALLVYNDSGTEYDLSAHDRKRGAILNLLERLIANGTPIHALGLQSHLGGEETRFNPTILRQFLADVASLGLKILVTELDVSDRGLPSELNQRDHIVASAYEDYLAVILDEPAVTAVLTWGLSDRYTWLTEYEPRPDGNPNRPLPLDAQFERKLAWNAIARAFHNAPTQRPNR